MANHKHANSVVGVPPAGGATTFRQFFEIRTWYEFVRRWRERHEVQDLLDLDDHMLADIGLRRCDVVSALETSPLSAADYLNKIRLPV